MRFAIMDDQRVPAQPGGRAACPGCSATVLAKCGPVVAWHWAHLVDAGCDWEPGRETDWHLNWKAAAPDERQEVRIGGHRADIVAPSGFVIELQHSHLSGHLIAERESAYPQMVWLFDGRAAREEGRLTLRRHPDRSSEDLYVSVRWEHPPAFTTQATAAMFIDLDATSMLWVGRWYQDSPRMGYGWRVPHEWFRHVVVNGTRFPRTPRYRTPLTKARIEAQIADPGLTSDAILDWRSHTTGPLRPCVLCGQPAFMRDDAGKPCHKVCAEESGVAV